MCHVILHEDLYMYCVRRHLVPRNLTEDQHEEQSLISGDMINKADSDSDPGIPNRVITGDETLRYLFNLQYKYQASYNKSP
jgi:hypothetical protein